MKQAMIMAAGMGTRLSPWTDHLPKALMEYQGKPLLAHVIEKLIFHRFNRIVINVHHFGGKVIDFLNTYSEYPADLIISDERDLLLDTGGGIRKASIHFHQSPVLIYNVDIMSNINLDIFWNAASSSPSIATLAVKERRTSRPLLFDTSMRLCGWENRDSGEKVVAYDVPTAFRLAFSGIYVLKPEFIHRLPDRQVFPIIPEILRIAKESKIIGYRHDPDDWMDMGKKESYRH